MWRFYWTVIRGIPNALWTSTDTVTKSLLLAGLVLVLLGYPVGQLLMNLDIPPWIPVALIVGLAAGGLLRSNYLAFAAIQKERDALVNKLGKPRAGFKVLPHGPTSKSYATFTPTDLARLFLNKSDPDIREIADPHVGTWWAFEGVIKSVQRGNGGHVFHVELEESSPGEPIVEVSFNELFRQYASRCYEGKVLRVEGQIRTINATQVWVVDCMPIVSE